MHVPQPIKPMASTPTTPFFEDENRPPLDLERVRRARELVVHSWQEGFRVQNETTRYFVTLDPHYDCNCGDSIWNNQICKHLIAALLHTGDEEARRKCQYWEQRERATEIAAGLAQKGQQALMVGRGRGEDLLQQMQISSPAFATIHEWSEGLLEDIQSQPERLERIRALEREARKRQLRFDELAELGKLKREQKRVPQLPDLGLVYVLGVRREQQAVQEAHQQNLTVMGASTDPAGEPGVFVVPIYPDQTGEEAVRGLTHALAQSLQQGRQQYEDRARCSRPEDSNLEDGGQPPSSQQRADSAPVGATMQASSS